MLLKRSEDIFHEWRKVRESNCRYQLTCQALVLVRTATEVDLISLFTTSLQSQQADVADIVLRTGVRTAGYVEIDRLQYLETLVKMLSKRDSVRFGVRCGEATTLTSCSGDCAG